MASVAPHGAAAEAVCIGKCINDAGNCYGKDNADKCVAEANRLYDQCKKDEAARCNPNTANRAVSECKSWCEFHYNNNANNICKRLHPEGGERDECMDDARYDFNVCNYRCE